MSGCCYDSGATPTILVEQVLQPCILGCLFCCGSYGWPEGMQRMCRIIRVSITKIRLSMPSGLTTARTRWIHRGRTSARSSLCRKRGCWGGHCRGRSYWGRRSLTGRSRNCGPHNWWRSMRPSSSPGPRCESRTCRGHDCWTLLPSCRLLWVNEGRIACSNRSQVLR